MAPSPTAAPGAGNTQGRGVSVTASRPGDKVVGKQDWGGLCCQPAAGLGIDNALTLLPDPVAIPTVPHTHAAEDAPAHLMSRVRPDSALGAAGSGLGKIWGTRGHLQVASCQHTAPSSPPTPSILLQQYDGILQIAAAGMRRRSPAFCTPFSDYLGGGKLIKS